MKKLMLRLLQDESGQDLIEYALLAAIIALAATAALILLGPSIADVYTTVQSKLDSARTKAGT